MKIVYDHQIFSQQRYGGVGRYFCELALQLRRNPGVDVRIEAPFYISEHFTRGDYSPRGMKVPEVKYTGMLIRGINELVLRRGGDADIVHETYYRRTAIGHPKAQRVVTVFDMIHEIFPKDFPPGDDTSQRKLAAARRAARVICISNSTRNDLIELLKIPEAKVEVVHLASSLKLDDARSHSPEEAPYILQVGARAGYKNFLAAARACAPLMKDSRGITMICFGGPPFSPAEVEELAALGISHRVKKVSGSDKDLATYYKHAIALVYPSLYEGFGLPPLEAMSLGCPVAASRVSSIPEVVGEAAVLFDPADVDSIRATVEQVVDSTSKREEMRAAGFQRARKFSWRDTSDRTLDSYRRLVG
jgi:glycosyltransferase involved in cell wall biosynthesis